MLLDFTFDFHKCQQEVARLFLLYYYIIEVFRFQIICFVVLPFNLVAMIREF
jgi:hypothetical protein